jgi:hypothetical protein
MAKKVNANALAWWTEEAFACEGEKMYVARDSAGDLSLKRIPRNAELPPDALFEVEPTTPTVRIVRPDKLEATWTTSDGKQETVDLFKRYPGLDSLFWTSAAVEKFLIPYYYAQRLCTEEDINRLRENCRKMEIGAIGHTHPSKAQLVPAPAPGWFGVDLKELGSKSPPPLSSLLRPVKETEAVKERVSTDTAARKRSRPPVGVK